MMEAATGARILGEVEETTLEEILDSLRAELVSSSGTHKSLIKTTHLAELDDLATGHFKATQAPAIALSGRHLPLIYKLASNLVSQPHQLAVLIIDLDGHFDATRLSCSEDDASHIYVHCPSRPVTSIDTDHVRNLIAHANDFLLYGEAAKPSASRCWWGTIVVGGIGVGDVVAGWKGWLRIDRESVTSFPLGSSVEEAFGKRRARQEVVDAAGWVAESQWGGFGFQDDEVAVTKDDS